MTSDLKKKPHIWLYLRKQTNIVSLLPQFVNQIRSSPGKVYATSGIHPSYSFTLQDILKNMLHSYCTQYPPWETTCPNFVQVVLSKGHSRSHVAALLQFRPGHPLYHISACWRALHSASHIHSGSVSYLVFAPVIKRSLLTKQCIWKVSLLCILGIAWSNTWHSEH